MSHAFLGTGITACMSLEIPPSPLAPAFIVNAHNTLQSTMPVPIANAVMSLPADDFT